MIGVLVAEANDICVLNMKRIMGALIRIGSMRTCLGGVAVHTVAGLFNL